MRKVLFMLLQPEKLTAPNFSRIDNGFNIDIDVKSKTKVEHWS